MKPEAVLQALIDYRIDLAPVLDVNGIVSWTAAVVKLAPDGWQNFVSERDFAQGDSPAEAVVALVAKLRRSKLIVVPEVAPMDSPKPSAPRPPKAAVSEPVLRAVTKPKPKRPKSKRAT